jgi:hypothetical protein
VQKKFPSKSCPLRYGTSKIQEDAMRLFELGLSEFLNSKHVGWGITSLAVGASKIVDIPNVCFYWLIFFIVHIFKKELSGKEQVHHGSITSNFLCTIIIIIIGWHFDFLS